MPFEPEGDGLIAALNEILHVARQQECLLEAVSNPTTLSTSLIPDAKVLRKRAFTQHKDTLPTQRKGC